MSDELDTYLALRRNVQRVLTFHRNDGWTCSCGYFRRDNEPRGVMDEHLAVHIINEANL